MKFYWIKEKSEIYVGENIAQILGAFFTQEEQSEILANTNFDEYPADTEVLPGVTIKDAVEHADIAIPALIMSSKFQEVELDGYM